MQHEPENTDPTTHREPDDVDAHVLRRQEGAARARRRRGARQRHRPPADRGRRPGARRPPGRPGGDGRSPAADASSE